MFLRNFPLVTLAGKNTAKRAFPGSLFPFVFSQEIAIATVALGATVFVFGCTTQRQQTQRDMLESQMRQQERAMRDMNDELGRSRAISTSLVMENQSLRGVPPTPVPEPAKAPIKGIELGRGTGGVDEDRVNGDEVLQVVVEPKDVDGHTVKIPGTLHLQVYEVQSEGLKVPLCNWDIGPEQLRKAYKSGLFQSGYVLILPWKNQPSKEKLRLVAQLRLESGQAFEVEKDFKVNLPAGTLSTGGAPPVGVGTMTSTPVKNNPVQVLPVIPGGMPGILPPPSTSLPGSGFSVPEPSLPTPFGGPKNPMPGGSLPVPGKSDIPKPSTGDSSLGLSRDSLNSSLPKPIATSGQGGDSLGNLPDQSAFPKPLPKPVPTVPTKNGPAGAILSAAPPGPGLGAPGEEPKSEKASPPATLGDPIIK